MNEIALQYKWELKKDNYMFVNYLDTEVEVLVLLKSESIFIYDMDKLTKLSNE